MEKRNYWVDEVILIPCTDEERKRVHEALRKLNEERDRELGLLKNKISNKE